MIEQESEPEDLIEKLVAFLDWLRTDSSVPNYDEAKTKQGVVLRALGILGWNRDNVDQVIPEFAVEGRRVDYCLRLHDKNKVFIEVKKPGLDLDAHQDQPLDYAFRQGVELTILTNGLVWMFYLSMKPVEWKLRKFYTVDVTQQDSRSAAAKFIDLLWVDSVLDGRHLENGERIYEGTQRRKAVEEGLPRAWHKMLREPDASLVELLSDNTEKLCGFRPEPDEAVDYITSVPQPSASQERPALPIRPRVIMHRAQAAGGDGRISRDELLRAIVGVLKTQGGKATKQVVQSEVYRRFADVLGSDYYQQIHKDGYTHRWDKEIAYARDDGGRAGLIKAPKDSGRGYWELTQAGWNA